MVKTNFSSHPMCTPFKRLLSTEGFDLVAPSIRKDSFLSKVSTFPLFLVYFGQGSLATHAVCAEALFHSVLCPLAAQRIAADVHRDKPCLPLNDVLRELRYIVSVAGVAGGGGRRP